MGDSNGFWQFTDTNAACSPSNFTDPMPDKRFFVLRVVDFAA
jgi:hypothetical protein